MNEHIYRDALAHLCVGKTEIRVGSTDRVDIVCYGKNEYPDRLIEVKPAGQLRHAIGQINSYATRWGSPCTKQIHLILSANRIQRNSENQRIQEHVNSGELDGIHLTTVVEKPLWDRYQIGEFTIGAKKPVDSLKSLVIMVHQNHNIMGYLCPEYKAFLLDLGSAMGIQDPIQVLNRALYETDTYENPINRWLMREHYRWVCSTVCVSHG